MRSHQVEARVYEIIERVTARAPVEDARVELKATWPEPARAARRLAAHANVAHGEPILWLIGLDENAARTPGAENRDAAQWLPQLRAQFDLAAPELLQHVVVPMGTGVAVVALLFDTRQAPYVVRNPAHGSSPDAVAWEVPWRDGASTRTARRSELLRILSPLQLLPDVQVMGAILALGSPVVGDTEHEGQDLVAWYLRAAAYFAPRTDREVVMPYHRCHAQATFEGADLVLRFDTIHIGREMKPRRIYLSNLTVTSAQAPGTPLVREPEEPEPVDSEYVLRSPSRLLVTAYMVTPPAVVSSQRAGLMVRLGVVGSENDLTIEWALERATGELQPYSQAWVSDGDPAAPLY